tara:strand:+ start:333 stop:641 length:309 start_codon:yes stop_codon:yes gene_type:complete
MANKDYSGNDYTNPARTHPEITLNVPIPYKWESVSYHNDVCPSFAYKGLQIFVMDDATKKLEGFDHTYSIILEEEYGEGNTLLNSNNWNEILKFVEEFNNEK